MTRKKST